MDPDEVKLQRFLDMLEVANRDTLSPSDLIQVIEVVLEALLKVKEEAAEALETAKKDTASNTKKVGDAVAVATKDINTTLKTHRALIDKIFAWMDKQKKSSAAADAAEALELAGRLADDVDYLERSVRELRKEKKVPGPRGKNGRMPRHKWEGTVLFIEQPDGTWDEGTDLKGNDGAIIGSNPEWGSGMTDLQAGSSNVHIRNGKIYVDTNGGGSSITIEVPPEAPDDDRVDFTFTVKPLVINMNGSFYREDHGWTWDAGTNTATMFSPVGVPSGVNGDIYAFIQL